MQSKALVVLIAVAILGASSTAMAKGAGGGGGGYMAECMACMVMVTSIIDLRDYFE